MNLTITPISFIYIVSGLLGLGVSTHAMPNYMLTFRAALRIASPDDRRAAYLVNGGILITEGIRLSIHILTTMVGVISLFVIPDTVAPSSPLNQAFGFTVLSVLMWANIGTTINTCVVWIQYKVLRNNDVLQRNVVTDLKAKLRRSERRAGRGDERSRDKLARLLMMVRRQGRRIGAEEIRSGVAEDAIDDHEDRIEVVEEKVTEKRRRP